MYRYVDQSWALMRKGLFESRAQLLRLVYVNSEEPTCFRHLGEIGIL